MPHPSQQLASVEMRVSARLMAAASPYFAKLLASSFREGTDLNTNGEIRIHLPDDDAYLFVVLLNIIHGFDEDVPRYLALDELLDIVVPVNKYQLGTAIKVHSDIWMDNSMGDLKYLHYEDRYCQELVQWVGLGWEFQHERSFTTASWVLIYWAPGPLNSRYLDEENSPILPWIFGKNLCYLPGLLKNSLAALHLIRNSLLTSLQTDYNRQESAL